MTSALVDVLGFIGGAISLVGFYQRSIPVGDPDGPVVRVQAGLTGDNDPNFSGKVSAAYAWDANNGYLGRASGGDAHNRVDIVIKPDSKHRGSRPGYVSISTKNSVCVSYIAVNTYDGAGQGVWTGDIGHQCGQLWYLQRERAGYLIDQSGELHDYAPDCTWLDVTHEGGSDASLKFSVPAYGKDVNDTLENDKVCDYTSWGPDDGPINEAPGKRSLLPREAWMEDELVVSNITKHKAEDLCSSETSWGPDFVGTDGMYCDMSTKTLIPLCSTQDVSGCVVINNDSEQKSVTKRSTIGKRAIHSTFRTYRSISMWE